jgi:hypothetical protein
MSGKYKSRRCFAKTDPAIKGKSRTIFIKKGIAVLFGVVSQKKEGIRMRSKKV